jgi:predicted alpha/beta-hydrolase family hydrolase
MSEPEIEQFADLTQTPEVRGFLHRPKNANGCGLVLTHGAGSNCQTELLRNLAETFAGAGFGVLRVNLPYRQLRPTGPPRPGDAESNQQGLKNAAAALKRTSSGKIYVGGHSYGGRQFTMVCAAEPGLVDGLLLLSYPLHPPRKPDQLRTQHFADLRTPALFVHGSRDGFGSLGEMEAALKLIPAKAKLLSVQGAGHELNDKAGDLAGKVLAAFQEFMRHGST